METENLKLERHPEYFGPLWIYIKEKNITDIDFNGTQLWITTCDGVRRPISEHGIEPEFLEAFSQRMANLANRQFNRIQNVLEVFAGNLRISLIHESCAPSGRSLSIRKSLAELRFSKEEALREGYCTREMMQLLVNCVYAGLNLVFCGEAGAGKTECAKFFSGFIPEQERVITIEETCEWHYRRLYPDRDCVELQVSERMDYRSAIRACLRQNPSRILVSEVRGAEVTDLLSAWSTGISGMTTLHTDDARKVPERIRNMVHTAEWNPEILSDIYMFVDAAVLLQKVWDGQKKNWRRRIEQVCFFSREEGENQAVLVIDEQKKTGKELPQEILRRMKKKGIEDPYRCVAGNCVEFSVTRNALWGSNQIQ